MPERLAVVGEMLVTYRFPSGSIGLAAPAEITAANRIWGGSPWTACIRFWKVCFRPDTTPYVRVCHGAHLRILAVPEDLAREFEVDPVQEVTYVNLDSPRCLLREAVRFSHGRHVLLERFREGVTFQVLADGSRDAAPDGIGILTCPSPVPVTG